ncbi:DNA mismatch repair protein Mlh3 isoform X1 [Astyanax mexicanus]|uniref:DNA mismatch repair protein Mlh3 isoform X1 n=1 Tax=Astyanax mexicanus TaxID=7994 RepID=UPI0020CB25E3|nr:DNA mismatch repair protein Mlh3 isoform X1 [Astyanax mexicanus]
MIRTLSKEVQAKLRSGVAVFSLQQCVEELVLNSIDAGATCIAVKIDIEACKVQVIDNGSGMSREDMEKVGTRYCTSKCSSLEDLDDLRFYGFRGEAIASIASLSTLVEISSQTKASVKTFVKTFNEGRGSGVCEVQDTRPSPGTTVLICNFFHNMPVRRKRMDSVLEVERLRQRVEAISLMHPSVSFTVKKDCSGTMLVQLPKARNTYYRFVQIHGLGRAQKLREVNFTHGQFEMTGSIGREGHYKNSLQFLFVNSRLVLKTRLHKLLNCLLRKLSSSSNQNNSPNASAVTSSPKQRGGADSHGVYVINLKCPYSEYDVCLEPAKSLIEFRDWDAVLFCVEEGVKSFLTKENLVSEFSVSDAQTFASVFSDPTGSSSPCSKATAQSRDKESTVCESDLNGNMTQVNSGDQTESVQNLSFDQIFDRGSSNAESAAGSEAEAESKEVQSVEKPSLQRDLEDYGNSQDFETSVHDLQLIDTLSNNSTMTHQEFTQSKVAVIGPNEAQDSLRRFAEPNICCAPKRKLSLLQTQSLCLESGVGPKMAKVAPRRKLTLAFETGSLDKFKRMYGKSSERQSVETQIANALQPSDCVLSSEGPALPALQGTGVSSLIFEPEQVEKTEKTHSENFLIKKDSMLTLSAYSQTKCSTSASSRTKISLAAKLSHLKCDKIVQKEKTPYEEGTFDDTRNEETTSVTQHAQRAADSEETFEDSLSQFKTSEDTDGSSKQMTETNDPNEPTHKFTVPNLPNPSAGDALKRVSELMTSSEPAIPSGHVINPASQHEPLPTQTGNEVQAPDESPGDESDVPAPVSSDWRTHYDDSLGKLVYINQVTGLSTYEAPSLEENPVPCSKDVTNMAVSVVSKTGFEYRCYPFQTDIVLPFLPKPSAIRALASSVGCRDELQGPGSLSALFSEWNNPVFVRPPQVAVDVTSVQGEGLAVKIHNILFPYRFTKNMIHSMKVIHQVDKKFLACLINTTDQESTETSQGNLLVLLDQHAAHERVRLEGLLTESYEDDPETPGKNRLCSSGVIPPLEISVSEEEIRLLRLYQSSLRDLALEMSFPPADPSHVLLERLPTCFIEKENTEQRRGRRTVIKSLSEEYLREHIEFLQSAGRVRSSVPLTVHNVLASQACHGAIKFNDVLSKEECCSLVGSLSSCQLPFQCAHGRPSIVPLVDLLHLEDEQDLPKPNLKKLRRMYKAWQLYGQN